MGCTESLHDVVTLKKSNESPEMLDLLNNLPKTFIPVEWTESVYRQKRGAIYMFVPYGIENQFAQYCKNNNILFGTVSYKIFDRPGFILESVGRYVYINDEPHLLDRCVYQYGTIYGHYVYIDVDHGNVIESYSAHFNPTLTNFYKTEQKCGNSAHFSMSLFGLYTNYDMVSAQPKQGEFLSDLLKQIIQFVPNEPEPLQPARYIYDCVTWSDMQSIDENRTTNIVCK
jgi:hypothetical protein